MDGRCYTDLYHVPYFYLPRSSPSTTCCCAVRSQLLQSCGVLAVILVKGSPEIAQRIFIPRYSGNEDKCAVEECLVHLGNVASSVKDLNDPKIEDGGCPNRGTGDL